MGKLLQGIKKRNKLFLSKKKKLTFNTHTQKKREKRVLRDFVSVVINCRRIVNKVDKFAGLFESVKADIVFGTESWLNPSISDSEVFLKECVAYLNERSRLNGGVFLVVQSSLRTTVLNLGHDAVASIWCAVTLPDKCSYAVGAFYQPPYSDLLQSLYEAVSGASCRTILLMGDFNLPDSEWRDGTCVCAVGSRMKLETKKHFRYV